MLKNIVGVVVSALIVFVLYFGPAIAGLIYGIIPTSMLEGLAQPERKVVYDGAWEISDFERDGDMDGDLDQVVDPTLPLAEQTQEAQEGEGEGEAGASGGGDGEAGAADSLAQVKPGARPAGKGTGTGKGSGGNKGASKVGTRGGTTRKKSRHKCPKTYEGIRKRSDGIWEVDRSVVNYYSSSVKHFNELGWSKSNDSGDKKGWYVTGFGCRDPLWHAGLRRRDIILKVNGKKTNNMMQILLLYSKVKSRKRFVVDIRRNGRELKFNYVIVK